MPSVPVLLQFTLASALLAVTPGTSVWGVVAAGGLGSLLAARPGLALVVTAVGGIYYGTLGLLALAAAALR